MEEENKFIVLADKITMLSRKIEDLIEKEQPSNDPYQSKSLKNFAPAFAKAQGEFPCIKKSKIGQRHRYEGMQDVIDAVKKQLANNGLSFFQHEKISENGKTILVTKILHASGEWIEGQCFIFPEKETHQAYGSALTYHKRYSAKALLGLSEEDDPTEDDGESNRRNQEERITFIQRQQIEKELAKYDAETRSKLTQVIYSKYGITSLYEILKSQYDTIFNKIKK